MLYKEDASGDILIEDGNTYVSTDRYYVNKYIYLQVYYNAYYEANKYYAVVVNGTDVKQVTDEYYIKKGDYLTSLDRSKYIKQNL